MQDDTPNPPKNYLNSLPSELHRHLVLFLTFPTLLAMNSVSRSWRTLTQYAIAAYLQRVTATLYLDCGRRTLVPVDMILNGPHSPGTLASERVHLQQHFQMAAQCGNRGSGRNANLPKLSKSEGSLAATFRNRKIEDSDSDEEHTSPFPVASFSFVPASQHILGPNHYDIRPSDSTYSIQSVSLSFSSRGESPSYTYAAHLPLTPPTPTIHLQDLSHAIFRIGCPRTWHLTYELCQHRNAQREVEFRPWLASGVSRSDAIRGSDGGDISHFFVPRGMQISWGMLTAWEGLEEEQQAERQSQVQHIMGKQRQEPRASTWGQRAAKKLQIPLRKSSLQLSSKNPQHSWGRVVVRKLRGESMSVSRVPFGRAV
ncbi:hypothetical protein DFS34DRAFT_361433 [Phlyctochytrium arcticum]|nr:hypothetical protein DFS34DRAFT_361433 [Phlyctochytrium arcticum]